ncbi:MAG: hypothetical protein F6K10_20205, partial [Moorea sp. SIO2B7]|nr:hypothetical protein [Moorena sp. SIO2B7]
MPKKRLKILLWSLSGVIGIVIVLVIIGNLVASQQEKKIEQQIEQFAKQFPTTKPNDSALKLGILTAKLGFSFVGGTNSPIDIYTSSHPDFYIEQTAAKDYQNILKKLAEYLDKQIYKPNDQIDEIPKELEEYILSKADVIETIIDFIINNDVLYIGVELTHILEGDYSATLPSYLNMANLQRILAVYILDKQSKGQTESAFKALEASWKFNQALKDQPILIHQLVAIITGTIHVGVMRKIDNVPPQWQERLLEHDYRQSLRKSLESEYVLMFNYVTKQFVNHGLDFLYFENLGLEIPVLVSWFYKSPLGKLYARFAAIKIYQQEMEISRTTPQQNICLSKSADFFEVNPIPGWWYIFGIDYDSSLMNQGTK